MQKICTVEKYLSSLHRQNIRSKRYSTAVAFRARMSSVIPYDVDGGWRPLNFFIKIKTAAKRQKHKVKWKQL